MVAGVHFVADRSDEETLLDHLGDPAAIMLLPWPYVEIGSLALTRAAIADVRQVAIANRALGPPVLVAGPDEDPDDLPASGIFARHRRAPPRLPVGDRGLIDSNRSPVILWSRGMVGPDVFTVSSIGSQADAMDRIGLDYRRWVERVIAWVRRRGTKVWGLEMGELRPELAIDLGTVSTVYALPGALRRLENGARATD